jgi:hypothetical protein
MSIEKCIKLLNKAPASLAPSIETAYSFKTYGKRAEVKIDTAAGE